MDPLTIAGVLIALATTFAAMFMAGMDPIGIFFGDPGSILLVFFGSLGATAASGTMPDLKNGMKALVKAFAGGAPPDSAGSPTSPVATVSSRSRARSPRSRTSS